MSQGRPFCSAAFLWACFKGSCCIAHSLANESEGEREGLLQRCSSAIWRSSPWRGLASSQEVRQAV